MRVLVTAFDPFGGMDTNSSLMTLKALENFSGGREIVTLEVPTVYEKAADIVWKKAKEVCADAIICLGQAGGRNAVTIEVIAINYAYAHMGDNEGVVYEGEMLIDNADAAIFSTADVKRLAECVKKLGFKAELSVSAGGFVCNSLLYKLLHNAKCEDKNMPIVFVHLPYEVSQNKEGFSMTCGDMALCVEEMIKVI